MSFTCDFPEHDDTRKRLGLGGASNAIFTVQCALDFSG